MARQKRPTEGKVYIGRNGELLTRKRRDVAIAQEHDPFAHLADAFLEPAEISAGVDKNADEELRRVWRKKRFEEFAREPITRRKNKQQWVCLAELLQHGGNVVYRELLRSLRRGEFRIDGRSCVLLLHPHVPPQLVDRLYITHISETYANEPSSLRDQYVCRFWVPRTVADQWCRKHGVAQKPKSTRGRKKDQRSYDDAQLIFETKRFVLAGHTQRRAVQLAVERVGSSSEKGKTLIRVRKKFREGLKH